MLLKRTEFNMNVLDVFLQMMEAARLFRMNTQHQMARR